MVKKQTAKDTLIVIKSVEEEGWPNVGTDVVTIPVWGTVDRDGNPTSESSTADCEADATFKKSQPYAPAFEVMLGHTTVSFSTEPDKIDNQDTSRPKRYSRGHDTYSGSLEFDKLKNNNRIEGAVDGAWNPDNLVYEPFVDFRLFEILTLTNPDSMGLNATSCDLLVRHFGVVLDSLEESRENIVRLSVPISRGYYRRKPFHTFPTTPQTLYDGPILGTGSPYTPDEQPREQSRFVLKVDDTFVCSPTPAEIIVYGRNVFDEPVSETFTIATGGDTIVLGFTYFDVIDYIYASATITAGDVRLFDYDYALRNPDITNDTLFPDPS